MFSTDAPPQQDGFKPLKKIAKRKRALIRLAGKLGLIEFSGGDYHRKYMPNSAWNDESNPAHKEIIEPHRKAIVTRRKVTKVYPKGQGAKMRQDQFDAAGLIEADKNAR
jgi:hypothetical protein